MAEGDTALRSILAEFVVEVDKAGALQKGNAEVDALMGKLVELTAVAPTVGHGLEALNAAPHLQATTQAAHGAAGTIGGFFKDSLHEAEHAVHGLHAGFKDLIGFLPGPLQHLAHMLHGPLGVAGAIAFAGYELAHMTLEAAEAAKAVDASARKLGISTDAYQVLGAFAKEAGSDVGAVGASVRTLAAAIVTPSKETAAAFQRIGIRAEELKGLSPEEVFYKVGGAIGELSDANVKQEVTAKLMGRGGQELIPIFEGGAEAIAEHRKELEELAIVYDKDFIAKSKKLVGATEELGMAWEKLKNQGLRLLMPSLTDFFRLIGHLLIGIQKFTAQLDAPRIAFVALAAVLPSLAPFLPLLTGFAIMAGRAALNFALMVAPLLVLEDIIGFLQGEDSEIGAVLDSLFGKGASTAVIDALAKSWTIVAAAVKRVAEFLHLMKPDEADLAQRQVADQAFNGSRFQTKIFPAIEGGLDALFPGLGSGLGAGLSRIGAGTADAGYGMQSIPVPQGANFSSNTQSVQPNITTGDQTIIINGVDPNNAMSVASAARNELGKDRAAIMSVYGPLSSAAQ